MHQALVFKDVGQSKFKVVLHENDSNFNESFIKCTEHFRPKDMGNYTHNKTKRLIDAIISNNGYGQKMA